MRDGRLERFCSTLCPGMRKLPGHFYVVRMRLLLEPGQKEQKPARFLCLREPKKAGQRNLRVALGAARPQCGRAAPGRAPTCADRRREWKPPAAGTNPMTSCPSKRDPLVAPLLSSSVEELKRFGSLLATPPPSVPRRGNLLLSCQRDKRSKTASDFFVLRTQRNRNPRKVTHPVSWAGSGNARYLPKSSAQSRRCTPAQGFAACLRTQPRRVSQPGFGVQLRFYLSSLHYSTPRLGGAGTGKTPLCGDFRCRDLRLRQARRKL